jgi:thiol-disulfide isomerase/thioredoxin
MTAASTIWGGHRPLLTFTRPAHTTPSALDRLMLWRGGDQESNDVIVDNRSTDQEELSLDEKVQRAMEKLGLAGGQESSTGAAPSSSTLSQQEDNNNCEDGVCSLPTEKTTIQDETITGSALSSTSNPEGSVREEQLLDRAAVISKEMGVDDSLVMAAFGATAKINDNNQRTYSEQAAKTLIQQEIDLIATVPEDCEQVQQLVAEGHSVFFSRRALAFGEMNMDDARAILLADAEDMEVEEEEKSEAPVKVESKKEEAFKTVTVDSNFDPTKTMDTANASTQEAPSPAAPKPAKKSDVVFEATTAQIQQLVLESPVPVLLDVYADWCGPCKVLGPALEEMAIKSGGMFRLVKVNSDNEKPIATALGVTALPSVFGVRDGRILHMFQGMPRDEEFMKNFMMGLLMPGGSFKPPVSATQKKGYEEMTAKLVKMAGAACFSFSARERLQDRIASNLDKLVEETGDASRAEESAMLVRALLSNIINDPYESKFRRVNLHNPKVFAKVTSFPSAVAILKGTGFTKNEDDNSMTIGKGKKVFNVAPLMVTRDAIDKWIDESRYEIAKAARKRKDEEDRARLEAEGHFDNSDEEDDEEEEAEDVVDVNACQLKVRMEGKKKVVDMSFAADDPVSRIIQSLGIKLKDDEEVQITCVAKKLVLKSTKKGAFEKTFRELGLSPSASVVVKLVTDKANDSSSDRTVKLSEKAALKKKKKGSHTMQSVGIYAKDDNAKAELIDGGGGVWYEHDVSDDEDEGQEENNEEAEEDASSAVEGEDE